MLAPRLGQLGAVLPPQRLDFGRVLFPEKEKESTRDNEIPPNLITIPVVPGTQYPRVPSFPRATTIIADTGGIPGITQESVLG